MTLDVALDVALLASARGCVSACLASTPGLLPSFKQVCLWADGAVK